MKPVNCKNTNDFRRSLSSVLMWIRFMDDSKQCPPTIKAADVLAAFD
jgi:hypothetical protein